MSQQTNIQWCDSTVNPTSGCDGCELWDAHHNSGACYAGRLQVTRLARAHPTLYSGNFADVRLIPGRVEKAARWPTLGERHPQIPPITQISTSSQSAKSADSCRASKPWLDGQPRIIFVDDLSDLFSAAVPFGWIADHVIDPILGDAGRRHFWIIVTKRPRRANQFAADLLLHEGIDLRTVGNLMLMTSVTSQATADARLPAVLDGPWAWRGASCEPLREAVQLDVLRTGDFDSTDALTGVRSYAGRGGRGGSESQAFRRGLDWVIGGGMSGPDAVPCDVAWLRALRDQCRAAGVPFFCKQVGSRPVDRNDRFGNSDDPTDWPDGPGLEDDYEPAYQGEPCVVKLADSHGGDWAEWPADLRVRQVPDFAAMMAGPAGDPNADADFERQREQRRLG